MPDFVELKPDKARILDRFVYDGRSIPELAFEFDMSEIAVVFTVIDSCDEINDLPWSSGTPTAKAEARIEYMERLYDRLHSERDRVYFEEAKIRTERTIRRFKAHRQNAVLNDVNGENSAPRKLIAIGVTVAVIVFLSWAAFGD